MPYNDMSAMKDGPLRSPTAEDDHDMDSLVIKPPRMHVSRDSSRARHKDEIKDKNHSKERRHKERYSDSSRREKEYHRGSRQKPRQRQGDVVERKDVRRGEERFQQQQQRIGYKRDDYMGGNDKQQRYHNEHYERLSDDAAAGSRGSGGATYHHGSSSGSGSSYHHGHHDHQYHHSHHTQIQMRQRQDYYEHRRHQQQDYHQPQRTDYYNHHHQQSWHNQPYEGNRGVGEPKYHDDLEKHKYISYEQPKDSESLEQDLCSRWLSKSHDAYERLQKEHDHDRAASKAERHKARHLKEKETVIEIVDSPEAEEKSRHSQHKKHERHKEKHEKRIATVDAEVSAKQSPPPEKRRSHTEKRKERARRELEACRELRRERAVNTLSPTAVAASVTAGLSVQIKCKTNEEDRNMKRKRLEKSSENDVSEEEDSMSNSESDIIDYKSKSKKKNLTNYSDGEISASESDLSIGELSKSPKLKSKTKVIKKENSAKSKYSNDEGFEENEEKRKRSSTSNTLTLSPSASRSRTVSCTSVHSSTKSHFSLSHSSISYSRSHTPYSKSRSHSRSSSRSPSRSSCSHSLTESRSRSRTRSLSEERDMKVNSHKEEKESKEKSALKDVEKKKIKDSEDYEDISSSDDEEGNLLPNYFPGIQGCRSVEEFQCLNYIEEGTYGVVYRAKDKRTNEIVALKRLKMENEKQGFPITLLREIKTLLKGQHPNIVALREVIMGSNMTKIFIVMDYVEHDLKSLMETMKARKQSFTPGEVKCLTQQLLTAVEHLHDNWILHRDLKTSNLLLSHKGILKVADFGLAREYGSPVKQYTSLVVTLWYRAPELLLCSPEYSTPIDIWSVGCIFAELLQMAPLFPGISEVDELNCIFKELGTPNEKIWPGYRELPIVKNMISQNYQFANYPVSSLRKHFSNKTSDNGIEFLQGLLTYDPKQRSTADMALKHQYFKELPVPIDPSMFRTWPAKSELGALNALASSPKPPSGDSQFKQSGKDDVVAGTEGGSGDKFVSGIIRTNNKASANTGFVLNASINHRQIAMAPGFNLKF